MHPLRDFLEIFGLIHPVTFGVAVVAASLLVLWRVEAMLDRGMEGTALGTLVLPYCSGLGNLVFVFLVLGRPDAGEDVIINSLVNNVTNLTLLLGLPALVWPMAIIARSDSRSTGGRKRRSRSGGAELEQRMSRLSLLLTLAAVIFFTGAVWVMGQDGRLDRSDGLVLIGLFLFWQCFQVFDTLKHNLRRQVGFGPGFIVDIVVVLASAWVLYESLDWLVQWLGDSKRGFFRAEHLGWITGWLLVLPNALVAIVFAARGRADIVYSSQLGDGHICIPLCIGIAAAAQPLALPAVFEPAVWVLLGSTLLHAFCLIVTGRLPRIIATVLVAGYGWFVFTGLAG